MTQASSDNWHLPHLLPKRENYQERLQLILPQAITGTTSTANPAAAAVVFVAMYVGAINHQNPLRPSTVLWMSDPVSGRRDPLDRKMYYKAAVSHRGQRAVVEMCASAGYDRGDVWYAGDSREPIRDESIRALIENGAMLTLTNVDTNASNPRYTLESGFAELFSPDLVDDELHKAIVEWQSVHLTPIGRRRAHLASDRSRDAKRVTVHLPDGGVRYLHPGKSSQILRGVVEQFCSARLKEPSVIFISQPGEKVDLLDGDGLERMGLHIDPQTLLPDCIVVDIAPNHGDFWFIEIVASDGPITETRRKKFLDWAVSQEISETQCHFLTAFQSRTHGAAKKALPQIAQGSCAWFEDEPDHLLTWDRIRPE
ncbi:BsuBI/PstI family type II restriction endonuclease [Nocardia carnea]|uniref:BsuBI/PstI family type II restriction endonuclease n=1 Tax=Nocardia carnea TaxID=37328 RepID=UPI002458871E|nr:BsuBI/PstI family type II restriction endonuclease [Nocardia carnea]